MSALGKYFAKILHHKRLGDSTGAIAGLACITFYTWWRRRGVQATDQEETP